MSVHYDDWRRIPKAQKKLRREAALFIRTARRHSDPYKWLAATQATIAFDDEAAHAPVYYALNEIAWAQHGPSQYGPYPYTAILKEVV